MTPKEECERLMNDLLPMGVEFLEKYGEFYPYGAVLDLEGTARLLGAWDGDEHPPSLEVLDGLREACQRLAGQGEIKASGLAWNAIIRRGEDGREEDAVVVSLEHRDGYAVQVAMPYSKGADGACAPGNLVAMPGEHNVFAAPPDAP